VYRIDGTENIDGKDLFKIPKCTGAARSPTPNLLGVNDQGIICWARINLDGELVKFNPPQTMIAARLRRALAGISMDRSAN